MIYLFKQSQYNYKGMAFKDSTFYALLQKLHPIVTNLPKIIKGFIKERHYLHLLAGAFFAFLVYILPQTSDLPFLVKAVIGWIAGYIPNFAWEWYHAHKGNHFDVNDVISGAYGGALILCLV
jgi:hypothetical protein